VTLDSILARHGIPVPPYIDRMEPELEIDWDAKA
jgi:hypothetical protein